MTTLNVDDVRVQLQKFTWPDYSMFVLMLATCAGIGIYFGFFEKKAKNVAQSDDYLVGGRNMKTFPVAMSLIARYNLRSNEFPIHHRLMHKFDLASYREYRCWELRPRFTCTEWDISILWVELSLWAS